MRRAAAALPVLALLALAAPAGAAARCDLEGSHTVAATAQARLFWVKGKGAERRLWFGCRRGRRPALLAKDVVPRASGATRTANGAFRLAGTWVAWHQVSRSAAGAGEYAATVAVRSLAGVRRRVDQDVSRYRLKALRLGADGSVAWVLAAARGLEEVGGVARGATRPVALAVGPSVEPASLALRGARVRFRSAGKPRSAVLRRPAPAPAGDAVGPQGLDGRFGDCGTLVPASPRPDVFTEATRLARAPSGMIVAAGTTTSRPGSEEADQDVFVIARFSPAGKFDASFGRSGVVQLPQGRHVELTGAAVQPDGKVLVAGHTGGARPHGIALRLAPDGSVDPSFTAAGLASSRIEDLALAGDGSVLVTGQRDGRWFVARLRADGSPDTAFGSGGSVAGGGRQASALAALAIAPDGTILAAGGVTRPLLVRLARDGRVLSSSAQAPPATAALRAVAPTPDGGAVATGVAANVGGPAQALLARYGADGRPAGAFGTRGFAIDSQVSQPHDIALAPDGGLLITADFELRPGRFAGSGLVRYLASGARDASFGFRGALGGTSSYGLDDHAILTGDDGTAFVAQDNGGAFAVSRFALADPATTATGGRPAVCAMATATRLAPLVRAGALDVSLRLRAPGRLRLEASFTAGGRTVRGGAVTVLRPYTEGAVASIPLSKRALALLRGARTARLTLTGGAPGRAATTYEATFTR